MWHATDGCQAAADTALPNKTDEDFKAMVIFLLYFESLLSKVIYHEHLLLLESNKNFI